MEIINFLNSHPNWEELLSSAPYNLSIRYDGDYVLFKYNQYLSDMTLPICREARGLICRKENDNWIEVCHGFDKFFNYCEPESDLAAIDWTTCSIIEKIDGTNIRFFYDNNAWHIATLGCINAFSAPFIDGTTFGDLVIEAGGRELFSSFDTSYTYIFELTGPNRIVINYGQTPTLWYLGRRNIHTGLEDATPLPFKNVLYPATHHGSFEDCLAAIAAMGGDKEGFVVTSFDSNGIAHRVKMKGVEYIKLHKIATAAPLTTTRIVEMWQKDELDDYIGANPDAMPMIGAVLNSISNLCSQMANAYEYVICHGENRKELAEAAMDFLPLARGYVFARLDDKIHHPADFLRRAPIKKLCQYLTSI